MALYDGAKLLVEEIKRRGITRKTAATELSVSPVTIHFWIKEKHRPSGSLPALIEAWSGGRVPREAWLSLSDRKALRKLSKGAA